MERFRPPRHYYVLLAIGVTALLVAVAGARIAHRHRQHQGRIAPAPAVVPASPAGWTPTAPAIPGDVTTAWAYLDSTEGDMLLGGDGHPHPLDQLIVPGLAEDYLNTISQAGRTLNPHDTAMLANAAAGDQAAAAQLTAAVGDPGPAVGRIIDACQLTTTGGNPPEATALDAARYAACLSEGAIVDHGTAGWIVDQMRRNTGGIGAARGNDGGQHLAQFVSTADAGGGRTRTGCIGIGAYWSAAVFVDWPTTRGAQYGPAMCTQIARDQFPPDTQKAPADPAPSESVSLLSS